MGVYNMQRNIASLAIINQFNSYMLYLSDVKKSSENTLQAYNRDLSKFLEFSAEHNFESLEELTAENIIEYKNHLMSLGLSVSSVSRSLSSLRSLYQYLLSQNLVTHNPAREIHNDKFVKKGPHILTNKEIDALLAQPNVSDIKGMRDKAMLELLYATGIKVTELISLNVSDINVSVHFLRVGNDEKERFIPLYKIAVKAVAEYIEKSRRLLIVNPDEQALFVNVSGDRMTRQGFWKILKTYSAAANIGGDITPHTLRHSFAAHLLENGADINDIKEILGHSDISSTLRYAQFLKEKIKTSYIKFHPRA
ncbi:MAG: tyrosine recombinase [Clostridia bacterium]